MSSQTSKQNREFPNPATSLLVKSYSHQGAVVPYVEHSGTAAMLCYCRSDDSILFVNQYRPVQQKDTWEIPSGLIEAAESPSEAAIRELREETGLIIEDAMLAGKVYSSVGLTTEVIWIFYAEVSTIHIDCEEPDLEVAWVSRSDAIVQMRVDQPCDAKTMLAILWLDKKIGSETC